MITKTLTKMDEAEEAAWKSLAGYKFNMFGYYATLWMGYNHLFERNRQPNPFRRVVVLAKTIIKERRAGVRNITGGGK